MELLQGERHLVLHRASPASAWTKVSLTSAAGPPRVCMPTSHTGCEPVVVGAADGSPPVRRMRSTLAAALLNSGCFETGSQSVIVSSLAARPSSVPGPCPARVSQYP